MADDLYYEDVDIGDDIGPIERTVNVDQVRKFLSIRGSDEARPSRFTSEEAAKEEGLPGPIVPGAMNIAMMSQFLTDWSNTVNLKKLDVVFRGMVPHQKPLKLSGIITDKDIVDDSPQIVCDVFLENDEGVRLVIGTASIVLAMKSEAPSSLR